MSFRSFRRSKLLFAVAMSIVPIACTGESVVTEERVFVPSSWRSIELGQISFRFPQAVDIPGHDDTCGGRSAPKVGCMVGIEGPVFRYARGRLSLRSRDDFGDRGPSAGELGERIRLNDVIVYRSRPADKLVRYTITADSGGPEAATSLWYKPRDALLWLTCGTEAECRVAKAIAGSVRFQSAEQACRRLQEYQHRPAQGRNSPPPPPAPPPVRQCESFL